MTAFTSRQLIHRILIFFVNAKSNLKIIVALAIIFYQYTVGPYLVLATQWFWRTLEISACAVVIPEICGNVLQRGSSTPENRSKLSQWRVIHVRVGYTA